MFIYATQTFTATDGTSCTAGNTYTVTDAAGQIAISRGQAQRASSPDFFAQPGIGSVNNVKETVSEGIQYAAIPLDANGLPLAPLSAGVVIIAVPTTDGNPLSAAQQIPSEVTITPSMTGNKLLYSTVVRDDTGIQAANIAVNPGTILIPSGVRFVRMSCSITYAADATKTGIRWTRLVNSTSAALTVVNHQGNSAILPNGVAPDVCHYTGAMVPAVPGRFLAQTAVQNSGAAITINSGNSSNAYASTWFQAEFFK